tara:strand:+ start:85 stop:369 length:285 start_codon:yes stop_codon:yes gene_type:complete
MNKLTDKELLELLKTDVESFNNYRDHFPDQKINFTLFNFEFIDLNGANLQGIDLRGANLLLANIENANIDYANLEAVAIILTKENLKAIKAAKI